MENLIDIESMNNDEIEKIISLAKEYKFDNLRKNFSNKHAALMFFENSTRTRFSFEYAINSLSAHPYIFDNSKSSSQKGEEAYDTINNLSAIGIDTFIIRTKDEFLIKDLKEKSYYNKVHFINAGSGKTSHPTQALLDYFTIKEIFGEIKGKKVAIIGDIRHSRVAKSNIALLNKVGAKVVTSAPIYFKEEIEGAKYVQNLDEAIKDANVIMCLRVQNERLEAAINLEDFIKNYQINSDNLPQNAVLIHPGPVNRGIEVSNELINSKRGQTILEQAENGKYVRMAILDLIFSKGEEN